MSLLSDSLASAGGNIGRCIMTASPLPRLSSVDTLISLAHAGESGRGWYRDARREVKRASTILGCSPEYLADILALYSPRVAVKRSIRFSIRYVQRGEHAPDVMRGIRSSVAHYETTGEIRGPKTGPFADAIKGDESAIVLDVWMANAFGIDQSLFSRKPVHAECCKRIRSAARRLGWTESETQAAVWCEAVKRAGRRPASLKLVHDSLFGPTLEDAA